jgi:hypothetical protein
MCATQPPTLASLPCAKTFPFWRSFELRGKSFGSSVAHGLPVKKVLAHSRRIDSPPFREQPRLIANLGTERGHIERELRVKLMRRRLDRRKRL